MRALPVADASQSVLGAGFERLDWCVALGVLALATLVGFAARKPRSARGLFLADRALPAWASGLSIAATELGPIALVSFVYAVYRPGGSFASLQLVVIGSSCARAFVGWLVLPALFEREVQSPYEWIAARLGRTVGRVATMVFACGALLAYVARAFLAALALQAFVPGAFAWIQAHPPLTPLASVCVVACVLSCAWALARGIARVVWADVVVLCVTLAAAIAILIVIAAELDTGWSRLFQVAFDSRKLRPFDFSLSLGRPSTFWAAAIAGTWGGMGTYGLDQSFAQRLLACSSLRAARRALAWSASIALVVIAVGWVGAGLFAYYERNPLADGALALYRERGELILAIFAHQKLPAGVRGLVVTAVFGAALCGMNALLPALAQALHGLRRSGASKSESTSDAEPSSLGPARRELVAAAALVCALAIVLERVTTRFGAVLELSSTFFAYTRGALLASFALGALRLRVDGRGWLWSAPLSIVFVFALAWHGPRSIWVCAGFGLIMLAAWTFARVLPALASGAARGALWRQTAALVFALLLLVWINRYALVAVEIGRRGDPEYRWLPLAAPWYVPIGSTIAFVFGYLLARPAARERYADGRSASRGSPATFASSTARAPVIE